MPNTTFNLDNEDNQKWLVKRFQQMVDYNPIIEGIERRMAVKFHNETGKIASIVRDDPLRLNVGLFINANQAKLLKFDKIMRSFLISKEAFPQLTGWNGEIDELEFISIQSPRTGIQKKFERTGPQWLFKCKDDNDAVQYFEIY